MSVAQIRQALLAQIESVEDERLLKMLYAMMEAYVEPIDESIIGYDAHGNPKTAIQMKMDLRKELEDAKSGKFISLSQLKTRSEKWLKGTK